MNTGIRRRATPSSTRSQGTSTHSKSARPPSRTTDDGAGTSETATAISDRPSNGRANPITREDSACGITAPCLISARLPCLRRATTNYEPNKRNFCEFAPNGVQHPVADLADPIPRVEEGRTHQKCSQNISAGEPWIRPQYSERSRDLQHLLTPEIPISSSVFCVPQLVPIVQHKSTHT